MPCQFCACDAGRLRHFPAVSVDSHNRFRLRWQSSGHVRLRGLGSVPCRVNFGSRRGVEGASKIKRLGRSYPRGLGSFASLRRKASWLRGVAAESWGTRPLLPPRPRELRVASVEARLELNQYSNRVQSELGAGQGATNNKGEASAGDDEA